MDAQEILARRAANKSETKKHAAIIAQSWFLMQNKQIKTTHDWVDEMRNFLDHSHGEETSLAKRALSPHSRPVAVVDLREV